MSAVHQAQQEPLVQQMVTLLQPTIPLARHTCEPRTTGSLTGPPAWLAKIGPIDSPRDMGWVKECNPHRPEL